MTADLFTTQRGLGEELLAAGWHAASIAVASRPGSSWTVSDPTRRIRIHMCADPGGVLAEITATHRPGRGLLTPCWKLTIHHAYPAAALAALAAAPLAGASTGRDKRMIMNALRNAGMRPDRCALVRSLSGAGIWTSPDRDAQALWAAPRRAETGGWTIDTGRSRSHLQATLDTPAAVLLPLISSDPVQQLEGSP